MGMFDFLFGPRGEARRNNSLLDQQRARSTGQSDEMRNDFYNTLRGAAARDNRGYNLVQGGYERLLSPESQYGDIESGLDWGDDGGQLESDYRSVLDRPYQDAGRGLRWGDTQEAELNKDRDWFRNFDNPMDEASQARMRGGGIYDEYGRTGGWDDARKADFRARANSVVPSFYGNLQNEMQRQAMTTGNQSGGMLNSSLARAARQAAMAGQDATRSGEIDLANAVDQGRQWGAQGMTASEAALQGELSRRADQRLGARGQAADIGSRMMSAADQRANAQGGMRLQGQGLDLQRRLSSLEGLRGLRNDAASRAAARGGLRLQGQGLDLQRQMGALGGMQNLYGMGMQEQSGLRNNALGLYGQENNITSNNLGQRIQNNPNRSLFQSLSSLASPFISAFASGGARG